MNKLIITSKNPVKIQATSAGFKKMFPDETFTVESAEASSEVSDQPKTELETLLGARNRVKNAKLINSEGDYYIGIEAGIEEKEGEMQAFAWVVIQSKENQIGQGKTGTFYLPPKVVKLIKQGKELGEADDIVFGRINSKQSNGAVGILTHDVITRTKLYSEAVVLALIPFKNPSLYIK